MSITLNAAQQQAVEHNSGEMLVVAGAGTGKTSVIVERIARLVASGVDKQQLLALTFTEKAAQEMLDRVSDRLEKSYGVEMAIHTFNGFGQKILQEFAVEIGLSSSFRLVGDDGKIIFLREHLDELELDYFAPISRPDSQLSTIADYFSELKQHLVAPADYIVYAEQMVATDEVEKLERKKHLELAKAFEVYVRLLRERNIIDYDDQIYLLVELLEKRPNVLRALQERYSHILVDEFQDTNPMQSRLIDLLYGNKTDERSLLVVGDDDQAIYGWRGATLANILDFTTRYPKSEQVALIENYRSTQQILDSAWRLIQHNNPGRLEHMNNLNKHLRAVRGSGKTPLVHCFTRPEAEIGWVADDVARRISAGQDAGSIAVLARSRRGVAKMHEMLESAGIEHAVAGLSDDLYKQPIILMMIEALRAVWNTGDSTALYHTLASRLFKCEGATVSNLANQSKIERRPLIDILESQQDQAIRAALNQLSAWHQLVHSVTVRELAYRILTDSGLKDTLYEAARSSSDAERDVYILGQWFGSLSSFERITITPSTLSYLDNFEVLRAEGENLDDGTLELRSDVPAVMTIHKSKGLEWQTVYVIDCASGSFPSVTGGKSLKVPDALMRTNDADARLPEERRLMYVAATRARDELILSYAHKSPHSPRKPSKFIDELGLFDTASIQNNHNSASIEHYMSRNHVDTLPLPKGMREGDYLVLSASQADDYLTCPLNFYYKHVLCVPEAPMAQTEVGSLFHSLIQQVNEARLYGRKLPTKESLLEVLNKQWPRLGYNSDMQRERALKHGLKSFRALYDRLVEGPIPIAVEEKFRVHIPDSNLVLNGRFDVVLAVDGGVEVHDYKTSTSADTQEKAKSRATANNQLTMYALAWRILHGEDPVQVSLDFVQTGQVGVVKKRASSLDTMQTKLADIVDNILAGKYEAGPRHDYCVHPSLD
jgi:DNA helicase-2/ATP-dependent DNA helicase PcrA